MPTDTKLAAVPINLTFCPRCGVQMNPKHDSSKWQAPAPALTADEVYERLNDIYEFSEDRPDEWRNQVARDLNHLIGRAVYSLETSCDESDIGFGNAVLRIVERVAEFEKIEAKGKPNE